MTARILVVDDVPANVRLLEAKLSIEYFEVLTAFDGPSALKAAAAQAPDLILLDVMMPGMDGFEVTRRLKADPKTRHIPVVMVTALTESQDRVRGLEAGADDFLSKPVNDVALFARVRSLARLKVMMDELRVRHAAAGQIDHETPCVPDGQEAIHGRVLLVESDDHLADKLSGYLTEAGHEVARLASGAEALAKTPEPTPDLIIVNLSLGGEDGLRLCSQFRSQETTRHVPILLILGSEDLENLAKGLDLGVTDYLLQPIDRNELRARTRTQVRRRRYHERLRGLLEASVSMAYTDPLTGIYNRRYMNAHLDRKIMEIARTAKPVSVLFLDIDHFKDVNDRHGHGAGDEVLKGVVARVSDGIRDFDLLARYGGEEFVVIMPDAAADQALMVAERLRRRIEENFFPIPGQDETVPITASIGVATATDPMEAAESLLARADAALFAAKRAGRNRTCSADLSDAAEVAKVVAGG